MTIVNVCALVGTDGIHLSTVCAGEEAIIGLSRLFSTKKKEVFGSRTPGDARRSGFMSLTSSAQIKRGRYPPSPVI